MNGINLTDLRAAISSGNIQWQRHSLERILQRGISRDDVIQTLLSGERIEDYPDSSPLPGGLFFKLIGSRPIHVVAAFNSISQTAFIITVYEADLEHFESDFKTRRKI